MAMTPKLLVPAVLSLAAFAPTHAQQPDGFWTSPTVHGAGRVHVWPEATMRPDTTTTYRAVFDVTQAATKPGAVNPGLDRVARAVNVFTAAGVPLRNLDFFVVVHGDATPLALAQSPYRAKFGSDNPNTPIINALTQAGVKITVCGNALADTELTPQQVDPKVKVVLSALSTLIMLQNRGYAMLRM